MRLRCYLPGLGTSRVIVHPADMAWARQHIQQAGTDLGERAYWKEEITWVLDRRQKLRELGALTRVCWRCVCGR